MDSLSVLVGKRIKELREAKNIKQIELANAIEMEATNLSKIEKGVHLPKEDTIKKITKVLDIEVKDLFDNKHLQSRNELMKIINNILDSATDKELGFFCKVLSAYKESR